jgi:hypothetical protein
MKLCTSLNGHQRTPYNYIQLPISEGVKVASQPVRQSYKTKLSGQYKLIHAHLLKQKRHNTKTLSPVRPKGTSVASATQRQRHNKRPCRQCDTKAHLSDTPPTRAATSSRRRYEDVVFDEKSANLYLYAHTTPAQLPTSAPIKEFLEALQRAMTRRPPTHTHTYIRWLLVTYMALTAEQLPAASTRATCQSQSQPCQ